MGAKKHAVKVKEFHDTNPKNVKDTENECKCKDNSQCPSQLIKFNIS